MFKRFFSLLLVAVLAMVTMSSTTLAATDLASADSAIEIMPFWDYTHDCSNKLSISGTTATCYSDASGYSGVTTKIVIEHTLQKKTLLFFWSDVDSWSTTINKYAGSLTSTRGGLSSGTYQLKTVYTIYSGSNSETIEIYSDEKKV